MEDVDDKSHHQPDHHNLGKSPLEVCPHGHPLLSVRSRVVARLSHVVALGWSWAISQLSAGGITVPRDTSVFVAQECGVGVLSGFSASIGADSNRAPRQFTVNHEADSLGILAFV